MKRLDPTELALDQLREAQTATEVAPFLKHKSPSVVKRAAIRAEALPSGDIVPELLAAFRRLMTDPVKLDPGCEAKLNIAMALVRGDAPVAEVYCVGIRHRQMEATWGSMVDTAAPLRAVCAAGLVAMGYPDALVELTVLLTDPEAEARKGALKALADSGRADVELLLRYKALIGDKEADVMREAFGAILRLGPRVRSVPFVAGFLEAGKDEIAEAAALALGDSRLADAFPALTAACERHAGPARQGAMLWGVALLRQEEAIDYLFGKLEEGSSRTAALSLQALGMYKSDERFRERAGAITSRRQEPLIQKIWREEWARARRQPDAD